MATIIDEPRVDAVAPPPKRRSRLFRALVLLVVGAVIGVAIMLVVSSLSASTASVKTVADRWATAMEQNDPNRIVELYAENATWHDAADGTNLTGINGVKEGWSVFALPGFKVSTVRVEAAGAGGAAVTYTMSGTSSPFSGKPFSVAAVSVLQISDGKVTSETVYYNLEPLK